MANIKRIDGKTGVSFQITVAQGRDINGRQVRHYKTWKPEERMTERQMQKAVERAAADFEREIEQGYQTDNRQTFSEYARYVIGLKRTAGAREKTLNHYEYLLSRCDQAIGHLRLCDIRPQHLNLFYQNLQEEGVRQGRNRAAARVDLGAYLRKRKITREALAEKAGVSATTITTACRMQPILESKADQIAAALGEKNKSPVHHRTGQDTAFRQDCCGIPPVHSYRHAAGRGRASDPLQPGRKGHAAEGLQKQAGLL